MAQLPLAMRIMMESKRPFEDEQPAKRPRMDMNPMQAMQAMQAMAAMSSTGMSPMAAMAPMGPAGARPLGRIPLRPMGSAATPGAMSAAVAASAVSAQRSAAIAEAQAKALRSPAEVKQALLNHGAIIEKNATSGAQKSQLQEIEAQVARAKQTRSLPKRQDQALVSCFREGYAPGPEGLLRMLETGADPNTVSVGSAQSGFVQGMTPLLAAASWGKVDELRILIAAGADIHAKTPNLDNSVLHVIAGGNAVSWGMDKAIAMSRLIVETDMNLLLQKNSEGKTPQDWAKHEKKPKLAIFLSSYLG